MSRIRVRMSLSILLVCGSFAMWAQQSTDNGVVPPLVRFNGTLTDDNGKPPTGSVGVTFSLYREQQGGAPLWVETQNVQPTSLATTQSCSIRPAARDCLRICLQPASRAG